MRVLKRARVLPYMPVSRPAKVGHKRTLVYSAIALHVGLPDAFDVGRKHLIAMGANASQLRVASYRSVPAIARRGNLQHPADRLDPKGMTMLVDEVV